MFKLNAWSSFLGGVLSPFPPLPPILFVKGSISPASPSTALLITFLDRIYGIFLCYDRFRFCSDLFGEHLWRSFWNCLMPCNTKIPVQSAHAVCKKPSHTQNRNETNKAGRDGKNAHLLCSVRKGFLCFLIILVWTSYLSCFGRRELVLGAYSWVNVEG